MRGLEHRAHVGGGAPRRGSTACGRAGGHGLQRRRQLRRSGQRGRRQRLLRPLRSQLRAFLAQRLLQPPQPVPRAELRFERGQFRFELRRLRRRTLAHSCGDALDQLKRLLAVLAFSSAAICRL
ncbi:hypothetical protein [Gordoniibacillus kamchatkensis]|uniref:hypothetical protein n=1 Tax=Gordoniibacillus kamchatkensis TaxID=1590651 RepID=UPI0012E0B531|nr:hypothetical protein [Paenibacillus sp. VKM B-2647]